MNKILILEARFYETITDQLVAGALRAIEDKNNCTVERVSVPGVFEIPAAASMLWTRDSYNALITLGCVIRGETDHYEHICREVSRALMDFSTVNKVAHGFGILTCENMDQVKERFEKKTRLYRN